MARIFIYMLPSFLAVLLMVENCQKHCAAQRFSCVYVIIFLIKKLYLLVQEVQAIQDCQFVQGSQ